MRYSFLFFFFDAFGVTAQITRVSYFLSNSRKKVCKEMPSLREALFGQVQVRTFGGRYSSARTPSQGQEPVPAKRHLGSPIQGGKGAIRTLFARGASPKNGKVFNRF